MRSFVSKWHFFWVWYMIWVVLFLVVAAAGFKGLSSLLTALLSLWCGLDTWQKQWILILLLLTAGWFATVDIIELNGWSVLRRVFGQTWAYEIGLTAIGNRIPQIYHCHINEYISYQRYCYPAFHEFCFVRRRRPRFRRDWQTATWPWIRWPRVAERGQMKTWMSAFRF